MINRVASLALMSLAVVGTSAAAYGQQNHGNFQSTSFFFDAVTEDSATDPITAGNPLTYLFNPPINTAGFVTADTLRFNTTARFSASASATTGNTDSDTTDGKLNFAIRAKPGNFINSFAFAERGDYSLTALGANALAAISIGCVVSVRVVEINGAPVVPITGTFNLIFLPGGVAIANGPASITPLSSWTGSNSYNIDNLIATAGFNGFATKVEIALDNNLVASAVGGQGTASAFIAKKQAEGVAITVIPAPGAAALGCVALLAAGRRRR